MSHTARPEVRGRFGVVASTHWIGSAVGFGVLERGGNAFDAAVAAGFALQVVEPHLNGPGGEVPILGLPAGADRPFVLCGQGVAPAAATPARFADLGLRLIPGTGHLPAVVPGAFDAWMLLLRDHGRLEPRDVLAPAIALAEDGFPLVHRAAASIHAIADHFRAHWAHSAAVWLPDGRPPAPGATMRTPGLAATYRRILAEAEAATGGREARIEAARSAWSQGFVAEAVDRFLREPLMDVTGRAHAGLLTGEDMARWSASYEAPISAPFGETEVFKTGPWGQGTVLLQLLGMLADDPLEAMDPLGPERLHLTVEALKLALADRDAWLADPEAADVPLNDLLSRDYLAARRAEIGSEASRDLRPGAPGGRDPGPARAALLALAGCEGPAGLDSGEPTFADLPEIEGDTVHLDVVDRWGNMVSATPSGGWLQSSPAVPGLGFSLTTRGQMFWLDPHLPGALAPGRRPRVTLSPTLMTRGGRPWLAIGTPGGDQQDQWIGATLLRLLRGPRTGLQAAIEAPLFHTAHYVASFYPRAFQPAKVMVEGRVPPATVAALRERGHEVQVMEDWSIGRVCAAGVAADGSLRAGASPRFAQAQAVGR